MNNINISLIKKLIFCIDRIVRIVRMCTGHFYRPHGFAKQRDNALGSIRLSVFLIVCLSVCLSAAKSNNAAQGVGQRSIPEYCSNPIFSTLPCWKGRISIPVPMNKFLWKYACLIGNFAVANRAKTYDDFDTSGGGNDCGPKYFTPT